MWWAKEKALTRVLQISAFYVDYRPTTSDRPEGCCLLEKPHTVIARMGAGVALSAATGTEGDKGTGGVADFERHLRLLLAR